jgi:hypothetical protein
VSILQLTCRIYRIQCGASSSGNKDYLDSKVTTIEKISEIKSHRRHLINKYKLLKSRVKLPIAEAAYNGKWEIIDLINKKDMLHCYYTYCWRIPMPLPPRMIPTRFTEVNEKLHMLQIVAFGMNEQSTGEIVEGLGWVGPDHTKAAFGVTYEVIARLWGVKMKARDDFLARRLRKRLIVMKLKKQAHGDREMIKAIMKRDATACLYLAQNYSTSIDLETDNGFTALIAAAEGSKRCLFVDVNACVLMSDVQRISLAQIMCTCIMTTGLNVLQWSIYSTERLCGLPST